MSHMDINIGSKSYIKKSDQTSKNYNESSEKSSFEIASHRLRKGMPFRYIDS